MNGITYFRLNSAYDGDVTKNCALTGSEVDNNFYTLEGRDVKSVELEDGKIIVKLMNGNILSTDNITEDCLKELSIDFDEVNGVLTITKNGVTQTIEGFATNYNIAEAVCVDGTLKGNGLSTSPIGLSPMAKTGQYRPVNKIINVIEGEKLPCCSNVSPGDRFLTIENVNEFGYLYNYEGLKKIACKLNQTHSQWRVPTKDDWDDMLNAVEPIDDFRNHNDARSNKFLGKFAGKFLKSKNYWEVGENDDDCCHNDCYDECNHCCNQCNDCNNESNNDCHEENTENTHQCGENPNPCIPSYCGEYGNCHYTNNCNCNGIDKYGFNVLPAGYANEAKDYLYFKERAYFWTATNHEYRDAYIKAFAYNKCNVLQDVMASDNFMSVRLVKDYTGDNFNEREDILGSTYSTVLMPSMKKGSAIWTSVNICVGGCNCDCDCECNCHFVLPNNGEGYESVKKFFINEWTGKEWLRNEIKDGESVVVISNGETNDYIEYRVMNGELVDVSTITYDSIIGRIQEIIDELNQKVDNEIERSTEKDEELEQSLVDVNEHLDEIDNNINSINQTVEEQQTTLDNLSQIIEDEISERQAEDARLQEEINAITGSISDEYIIQDGSGFNNESGVLTLKSKSGNNDINIQFSLNFGTF